MGNKIPKKLFRVCMKDNWLKNPKKVLYEGENHFIRPPMVDMLFKLGMVRILNWPAMMLVRILQLILNRVPDLWPGTGCLLSCQAV